MPPTARPWFRFYSDALQSRKAQKLKPNMFKHWVNLLCLANVQQSRGRLPCLQDIAFAFRMTDEATQDVIEELVTLKFIDPEGDAFVMHDWDEWQKDRDVSPSLRGGKRDDNRANVTLTSRQSHAIGDDSVTRGEERRGDKEKEEKENREEAPVVPVVRAFERCFGRLLSPMEIENIKALDEEHPRERIDYALREAAELNKRNVRYIQRICENQAQNGDDHERKGMGRNAAGVAETGDAVAAALGRYGDLPEFDPDYWTRQRSADTGPGTVAAPDDSARVEA